MRKMILIVLLIFGIVGTAYAQNLKDCNLNLNLPDGWQKMDAQDGQHGFFNRDLNEMILVWGHPTDEEFSDIDQIGSNTEKIFVENYIKSNTDSLAAQGVKQRILNHQFKDFKNFRALILEKSQNQKGEMIWIREVDTMKSGIWTTIQFAYASKDEMKAGEENDFKIVNSSSVLKIEKNESKSSPKNTKMPVDEAKDKAQISGIITAVLITVAIVIAMSVCRKLLRKGNK